MEKSCARWVTPLDEGKLLRTSNRFYRLKQTIVLSNLGKCKIAIRSNVDVKVGATAEVCGEEVKNDIPSAQLRASLLPYPAGFWAKGLLLLPDIVVCNDQIVLLLPVVG